MNLPSHNVGIGLSSDRCPTITEPMLTYYCNPRIKLQRYLPQNTNISCHKMYLKRSFAKCRAFGSCPNVEKRPCFQCGGPYGFRDSGRKRPLKAGRLMNKSYAPKLITDAVFEADLWRCAALQASNIATRVDSLFEYPPPIFGPDNLHPMK